MQKQPTLLTERDKASSGPRALKDPGSIEYAWQTVSHLKLMFQLAELSVKDWEAAVADAERHKIYERIPPENPYGDIDSLLHAEVGLTKAQAERDVALRAEIALPQRTRSEAKRGNKNAAKEKNNLCDTKIVSVDADYWTGRIARDHPDILDRMKSGDYPSVRAAAKEAGLVKSRISISMEPDKAARTIRRHFDDTGVAALIEALSTPEDIE